MINGIPSLIVGNLGRDPEFQLVNGKQIARISIGVTPRVKKQGQWQDAPALWYRVTIWDTYLAEHVLNSLHKGDRVFAYGVVTSDEYQGKTNLEMSADIVGVPLDRNEVTIIPRQQGNSQRSQQQNQHAPGYANRQATRQQAHANDPWGSGNGFTGGGAEDFGGSDEPEF